MINNYEIDGINIVEVIVNNLENRKVATSPILLDDISHFFSVNYSNFFVQDLSKIQDDFFRDSLFIEKWGNINGLIYLSSRALVKHYGLKFCNARDHQIPKIIEQLIEENSYSYVKCLNNNQDICTTFHSVYKLGHLRSVEKVNDEKYYFSAGFFILDPIEDDTDFTAVGDIIGIYTIGKEIIKPAILSRPSIICNNRELTVANIGWADMLISFDNETFFRMINRNASSGIKFYNRALINSLYSPFENNVIEFAICNQKAVCYKENGGIIIPNDGFVIRIDKNKNKSLIEYLIAGGRIFYALEKDYDNILQGGIQLVKNRNIMQLEKEMSLFYPKNNLKINAPPLTFKNILQKTSIPKAVVASNKYGTISFTIFEKGNLFDISKICSTKLHYENVILLDSGGSAQIFKGNVPIFQSKDSRGTEYASYDRMLPLSLVGY